MKTSAYSIDIILFAATAGAALYYDWDPKTLVWGLWLSSLTVGYAYIVLSFVVRIRGDFTLKRKKTSLKKESILFSPLMELSLIFRLIGGLFGVAFFTIHFGSFHFVHSIFLNIFFPLFSLTSAEPETFIFFYQARKLLEFFTSAASLPMWSFAAASFVARRHLFKIASIGNPMRAYLGVCLMHIMIFVFGLLHVLKVKNGIVYIVVLSAFFFPWRSFFFKKPIKQGKNRDH